MRRFIIALSLLSIFCLADAALAMQRLRVGVPCFQGQQCKFTELAAILHEAFSRAGLEPSFTGYPMLRDLKEANSGHLDASGTRTPMALKGYPNLIQVPVPIARVTYVFFSAQNVLLQGWDSLHGLRVGVMRGDMTPTLLTRQADIPLLYFNDPGKGFRMLKQGRLDAIVYDKTLGAAAAQAAGLKRFNVSPAVYSSYTYLSLNKKHANLIPGLSKALSSMLQDGTTKRLAGRFANMIPDWKPKQE